MRAKALFVPIVVPLLIGPGCSDDPPPPPPFGQVDTTAPDGGGGGRKDASVDRDPGYRDPSPVDGGCAPPNLVCDGKCLAAGSDVGNCGTCGNQCMGPGATCNAGLCGCTGPLFDYCGTTGCMDVSSDFNHCGTCGKACNPNSDMSCVAGVCVPK